MTPSTRPTLAFAVACGFAGAGLLAPWSTAALAQTPTQRSATDACEAAVTDTVHELRGRDAVKDVQFNATRRVTTIEASGDTSVNGEGRYRLRRGGERAFRYSCAYNPKTDTTGGVVLRDNGGAVTPSTPTTSSTSTAFTSAAAATRDKPWEPDLSRLSPEACETAAAASLKRRYPSVQQISFANGSRKLQPGLNNGTTLEGAGRMERAPGLNPVRFSYRCDFEARSGRLLGVSTSDTPLN